MLPGYFYNYLIDNNSVLPDTNGAISFFKEHIVESNKSLVPLLIKYQFKSQVPSWKWELLAAILLGDIQKKGNGNDLLRHEVKSSCSRTFEYQYCRKSWREKISQERLVDHIFISYTKDYSIQVRRLMGSQLGDIFNSWETQIAEQMSEAPNMRYRRSLSLNYVKDNGELLLDRFPKSGDKSSPLYSTTKTPLEIYPYL